MRWKEECYCLKVLYIKKDFAKAMKTKLPCTIAFNVKYEMQINT